MDAKLIEFNGEEDHIHLLLSCPPKLAVATLVQKLKGKSAYFLRREFWPQIKDKLWGNHFWSRGYFVSTMELDEQMIKRYVKYQEQVVSHKLCKI